MTSYEALWVPWCYGLKVCDPSSVKVFSIRSAIESRLSTLDLRYRGVPKIPRAGLQPASFTASAAHGQPPVNWVQNVQNCSSRSKRFEPFERMELCRATGRLSETGEACPSPRIGCEYPASGLAPPQLFRGDARAFGHRLKLRPSDLRMTDSRTDATVGSGNDVFTPDDIRIAH